MLLLDLLQQRVSCLLREVRFSGSFRSLVGDPEFRLLSVV